MSRAGLRPALRERRRGIFPGGWGAGFTAFETLLAVTILAFITATVSAALSAGRQQSRAAQDTVRAAVLARGLIDEIVRLPFVDPLGYNSGLSPTEQAQGRVAYDNVTDYSGYTDGPTNLSYLAVNAGTLQVSTQLYPTEYQDFVRSVTMTSATAAPSGWGRSTTGVLITVNVSRNGSPLASVQRFVPGT